MTIAGKICIIRHCEQVYNERGNLRAKITKRHNPCRFEEQGDEAIQ
ncbi:hypothetical protein OFN97_01155 [Campylobacter sp. VBCF_05 NA6]|nr:MULTISPECIES: hypothetical protein [unclassified Campylobacter]MDA3057727.1 hypothetical protein [Campylobacter sp. VBCF_04 NA7]MDA3058628.1 hypothetical protein [Campylobacter sp. VBCF_05 NA6]